MLSIVAYFKSEQVQHLLLIAVPGSDVPRLEFIFLREQLIYTGYVVHETCFQNQILSWKNNNKKLFLKSTSVM